MDARTTRAYLTLRTHPNTTGDHKPRPSHNVTTSNIRVFRLNVCRPTLSWTTAMNASRVDRFWVA